MNLAFTWIVDTREPSSMYDHLSSYLCKHADEGKCKIVREKLEVGDYALMRGDEIYMIIERKTMNDLHQTLTSSERVLQLELHKRLRENEKFEVLLLVERSNADNRWARHSKGRRSIHHYIEARKATEAFLLTKYSQGVSIKETTTNKESVEFIGSLFCQIQKNLGRGHHGKNDILAQCQKNITRNKIKKCRDSIDQDLIPRLKPLLPTLSISAAKAILTTYPGGVVEILKEDPGSLRRTLNNLKVNGRRIAKNKITGFLQSLGLDEM